MTVVATTPRLLAPSPKLVTRIPPVERSQRVWHRALELADQLVRGEPHDVALDLLRTAQNDPTTMTHALGLGRAMLRTAPSPRRVSKATALLANSIDLLGPKPVAGDGRTLRPQPTPAASRC